MVLRGSWVVDASSCSPGSGCAAALTHSAELCWDCPGAVPSGLVWDGDNTHTPSPFSLFTDTTSAGGAEMRNGPCEASAPQTPRCLQQGLCRLCAVGGQVLAPRRGEASWATERQYMEPPLPSESSISTGRQPWSCRGHPLPWKGSRKAQAKSY